MVFIHASALWQLLFLMLVMHLQFPTCILSELGECHLVLVTLTTNFSICLKKIFFPSCNTPTFSVSNFISYLIKSLSVL